MRTKTPEQAEKILTVAARLFANHRFHEARMEDIAAEAQVGKGTLYRYFKDKDELYLALLERASEGLSRRLDEAVEVEQGPREKLVAFVAAAIAYFDEHPHLFDLIQHAEAMRRPGSWFPWQKARDRSRELILALFEQGQETGEFVITDPDMAVLMLQGGLRAVFCFGKQPPRPGNLARRIVEMFLQGAATFGDEVELPHFAFRTESAKRK